MFRIKFLATVLVAIVMFAACEKQVIENKVEKEEVCLSEEDQAMVSYLEENGFENVSIGDEYVSIDDMLFEKSTFWERFGHIENMMLKSTHYRAIFKTQVKNILIYLPDDLPNDWKIAFIHAVVEYNKLNLEIKFDITLDSGDDYHTKVIYKNFSSDNNLKNHWDGAANFPFITGKPGNRIYINKEHTLTSSKKKNVAAHEIGHTIALGHTSQETDEAPYEMSLSYSCKFELASKSFMYHTTHDWRGFTTCDIQALEQLY